MNRLQTYDCVSIKANNRIAMRQQGQDGGQIDGRTGGQFQHRGGAGGSGGEYGPVGHVIVPFDQRRPSPAAGDGFEVKLPERVSHIAAVAVAVDLQGRAGRVKSRLGALLGDRIARDGAFGDPFADPATPPRRRGESGCAVVLRVSLQTEPSCSASPSPDRRGVRGEVCLANSALLASPGPRRSATPCAGCRRSFLAEPWSGRSLWEPV